MRQGGKSLLLGSPWAYSCPPPGYFYSLARLAQGLGSEAQGWGKGIDRPRLEF